jgi:primase-polymerase (primpol)-like protein
MGRTLAPARPARPPSAHIDDQAAARIPAELRNIARWIVWGWEWEEDRFKFKKPPIDPRKPRGKRRINHLDPSHWMSLDQARKLAHRGGDGCGILPDPEGRDRLVPVDFDDCLDDAGRIIRPDTRRRVEALNSYTEITPSRQGLRVWVRGTVPGDRRRKDEAGVEIYPANQYATVTGWHLPGTPTEIRDAQEALEALYYELWPESKPPAKAKTKPNGQAGGRQPVDSGGTSVHDDEEVLGAAMKSQGFPALWQGDWEGAFDNQSSADMALVNRLAFYCGPGREEQVKRLFLRSGLAKRKKAMRRDYPDRTVDRAYRDRVDYFRWDRSPRGDGKPPPGRNGNGRPGRPGGGEPETEVNEAAEDPHRLARIHFEKFKSRNALALRFHRSVWLKWSDGAYRPVADRELQCGLVRTIKAEFDRLNRAALKLWEESGGKDSQGNPVDKPRARMVTHTLVSNVILALESMAHLPDRVETPAWVDGDGQGPSDGSHFSGRHAHGNGSIRPQ